MIIAGSVVEHTGNVFPSVLWKQESQSLKARKSESQSLRMRRLLEEIVWFLSCVFYK